MAETISPDNNRRLANSKNEETPFTAGGVAANDADPSSSSPTTMKSDRVWEDSKKRAARYYPTDASFLPRVSRLLPMDFAEQEAHLFQSVTLSSTVPSVCGICNEKVGRKEGIICKQCGLIVHSGDRVGKDASCHAEAMLMTCEKAVLEESLDENSTAVEIINNHVGESSGERSESSKNTQQRLASRRSMYDRPHTFKTHSYGAPTYCAVCQGLLVGLWSQGLQCVECKLNVHRGEGTGEHDDCKSEALFWPCAGERLEEDDVMTLREAIRLSPNFIKEVVDQAGKDLHSHAKAIVVDAGVEGERSKKLRRLRKKILAVVDTVDAMESRGEIYCLYRLMRFHIVCALVSLLAGLLLFTIGLCLKLGFDFRDASIFHLALLHELTVFCTIHMCLILMALVVRHYALFFMRKSFILDRFLRDMFGIEAEQDLGIAVTGAARRMRSWSDRMVISAGVTFSAALLLWALKQPTLEELRMDLQARSLHPNQSLVVSTMEL